jgi:uncharacterized membrane protein YvbJ
MQCPRCQHEAPRDAEFCPECGAKLGLCSQCGTANAPGHKFCKKCGQSLTGGPGSVRGTTTLTGRPRKTGISQMHSTTG